MDVQPRSQTRLVDHQISTAEQLISDVLVEADAGSFGTISNWRYNAPQPSAEQSHMQIANKVIPLHLPPCDTSTEVCIFMVM